MFVERARDERRFRLSEIQRMPLRRLGRDDTQLPGFSLAADSSGRLLVVFIPHQCEKASVAVFRPIIVVPAKTKRI